MKFVHYGIENESIVDIIWFKFYSNLSLNNINHPLLSIPQNIKISLFVTNNFHRNRRQHNNGTNATTPPATQQKNQEMPGLAGLRRIAQINECSLKL